MSKKSCRTIVRKVCSEANLNPSECKDIAIKVCGRKRKSEEIFPPFEKFPSLERLPSLPTLAEGLKEPKKKRR
jgi:hypothetical protein